MKSENVCVCVFTENDKAIDPEHFTLQEYSKIDLNNIGNGTTDRQLNLNQTLNIEEN